MIVGKIELTQREKIGEDTAANGGEVIVRKVDGVKFVKFGKCLSGDVDNLQQYKDTNQKFIKFIFGRQL